MRPQVVKFSFSILLTAIFLIGCSSGRAGSVYVTQQALVVCDTSYPLIAVFFDNKIKTFEGHGIAPMNPLGRFVVIQSCNVKPEWIKFEPGDPKTPRVLVPAGGTRFQLFDLLTGKSRALSHTFDQRDERVYSACVDQEKFAVEIGSRYTVGPGAELRHYQMRSLPDGGWQPIDEKTWNEIKGAATSLRINLKPTASSMTTEGWGNISVQHRSAGWITLLRNTAGNERVLLEQNDWGLVDASRRAACMCGPIWP